MVAIIRHYPEKDKGIVCPISNNGSVRAPLRSNSEVNSGSNRWNPEKGNTEGKVACRGDERNIMYA
jgi:hypothetical protein